MCLRACAFVRDSRVICLRWLPLCSRRRKASIPSSIFPECRSYWHHSDDECQPAIGPTLGKADPHGAAVRAGAKKKDKQSLFLLYVDAVSVDIVKGNGSPQPDPSCVPTFG